MNNKNLYTARNVNRFAQPKLVGALTLAFEQSISDYMNRAEKETRSGAPGGIRTPDQQDRNLLLYPAELQALTHSCGR